MKRRLIRILKRWYVQGPLIGAACGFIAWTLGVPEWRPILVALVVTAFSIWARRAWPEGAYWPWPATGARVYSGGSHQVSRLTISLMQRDGSRAPDRALQRRLRRLAMARLHRLGIGWDSPRARPLLGSDVYDELTATDFDPDLRGVAAVVAAIERLDPAVADGRLPGVETGQAAPLQRGEP